MLRLRSGVLIAVILAVVWSAAARPVQRTETPRAIRELRVEQWLELVRQHEPGLIDAALRSLRSWPEAQLLQLRDGLLEWSFENDRLPVKSPEERRSLFRRAATLHAELAMLARFQDAPVDTLRRSPMAPASVIVDDGQSAGFATNSIHWQLGRVLIDSLEPEHLRDAFVSLWYRASAEFMIAGGDYAATQSHLACAQRVLADEAHVWLASGVVRAHYATPSVQNAMAGVKVPFGFYVMVNDRQAELDQAERFLRRAVELEPRSAEAQLRYGWVLVQQQRLDPAFDALRAARAAASEPVLEYFAALFLGVAEAAAGRHDAAGELFEQASRPFPTAQAPLLALSELAMRRGDRAAASAALHRLLALPPNEREDPWWNYGVVYGRHWRASWSRMLERLSEPGPPPPGLSRGSPCMRR
jgi:hypothetical protein